MAERRKQIVAGRVTKRQKVRLLEILWSNRNVGRGQYVTNCVPEQHIRVWEEVTWELNNLGGAHKKSEQWKKYWFDWKASAKKIIDYFSRDFVDGDGSTPEGGFNNIEILENITAFVEIETAIPPKRTSTPSTSTPSTSTPFVEIETAIPPERTSTPSTSTAIPPERTTSARRPRQLTAARRPRQPTASSSNSFRSCFEETKRYVDAQFAKQNDKLDAILLSINKQNEILKQILEEIKKE